MAHHGSPLTKKANPQNKTITALKERELVKPDKPNFVLVMKTSDQPNHSTGTQIRRALFSEITKRNWNSENKTTSQFYFRRDDRKESDFIAEVKQDMEDVSRIVHEMFPGDWGFNWIVLRPLEYRIAVRDDQEPNIAQVF